MCNCKCQSVLASTGVTNNTTNITITLPAISVNNNQEVCFTINQTIPSVTTPIPVYLSINSVTYEWINHCSNYVYSDQITTNRTYVVRLKTDSLLAKNMKCNLLRTQAVIPSKPVTA